MEQTGSTKCGQGSRAIAVPTPRWWERQARQHFHQRRGGFPTLNHAPSNPRLEVCPGEPCSQGLKQERSRGASSGATAREDRISKLPNITAWNHPRQDERVSPWREQWENSKPPCGKNEAGHKKVHTMCKHEY